MDVDDFHEDQDWADLKERRYCNMYSVQIWSSWLQAIFNSVYLILFDKTAVKYSCIFQVDSFKIIVMIE